jgi:membrane protease YdiL (CAAX protease family)
VTSPSVPGARAPTGRLAALSTRAWLLAGYLAAVTVAEALLAISVPASATGFGLLALALCLPFRLDLGDQATHLRPVLLAIPVVRLVTIGAPGADLEPVLRTAMLAVPIAATVVLSARGRPETWRLWRPGPSGWRSQALVALAGVPLGLLVLVVGPTTAEVGLPVVVVAALLVVAVVPEEVLYRGLLVPAATAAAGDRAGILLSAGLYAATFAGYGNPGPVVGALATGLTLGWLRHHTGSVVGVVGARIVLVLVAVLAPVAAGR